MVTTEGSFLSNLNTPDYNLVQGTVSHNDNTKQQVPKNEAVALLHDQVEKIAVLLIRGKKRYMRAMKRNAKSRQLPLANQNVQQCPLF